MGHGIGIWLDPATGQVMISQSLYVAGEIAAWLAAIVAGLVTAWLVLP